MNKKEKRETIKRLIKYHLWNGTTDVNVLMKKLSDNDLQDLLDEIKYYRISHSNNFIKK